MADISKVLIPALDGSPGGIYNIKDTVARQMLSGGIHLSVVWNGHSIPDVSNIPDAVSITYNGVVYNGTLAAEDAATMTFYLVYNGVGDANDFTEYVAATNELGNKYWEKLGVTGGSMNNLGALAYMDAIEFSKGDGAFVIGENATLQASSSGVTFENSDTTSVLGANTSFTLTDPVYSILPTKGNVALSRTTDVSLTTSANNALTALDSQRSTTETFIKADTNAFVKRKINSKTMRGVTGENVTATVTINPVTHKLRTSSFNQVTIGSGQISDYQDVDTSFLETTTIRGVKVDERETASYVTNKTTKTLGTDTFNKVNKITANNAANNEWKDTVANLDIHMWSAQTDPSTGVFAEADSETLVLSFKTIPSVKVADSPTTFATGKDNDNNNVSFVKDFSIASVTVPVMDRSDTRVATGGTTQIGDINNGATVVTGISNKGNIPIPVAGNNITYATGGVSNSTTTDNAESIGDYVVTSVPNGSVNIPQIDNSTTEVLIKSTVNATSDSADVNVLTGVNFAGKTADAYTGIAFEDASFLNSASVQTQPEFNASIVANENGSVLTGASVNKVTAGGITVGTNDLVDAVVDLGTATAVAQEITFANKDLKKVILYDDLEVNAVDNPNPTWLYFTMPQGGTVTLTKNGTPTEVTLEYSVNDGRTWTEWVETENVRSLTLVAGQTMHVRNTSETSTRFSTGPTNYYNFSFTSNTYAGGNTNSLLCKTPSIGSLTNMCYYKLFENSKIVTAPELPSTTLVNACYYSIFSQCVNLVSPPKELPATILSQSCYHYMFYACSSLIIPDDFILPAPTLNDYSYYNMFRGCTNVNLMHTNMIDISASNCLSAWLASVSPTGDFYCPAELTIPTGASGIPSGWTRHDYPDNTWLHFKMPEGGTVSLTKNGTPTEVTLEYSLDNGASWIEWIENENVRSLTLAAGQTMHVRNTSETSTRFSAISSNYYTFAFSANTYAGGNTNSLLCKNPSNAVLTTSCYNSLFKDALTLKTPSLLPSLQLATGCYLYMFRNSGITYIPELPATIAKDTCYGSTFRECTNILNAEINLTNTDVNCCLNMFNGASSLKNVKTKMTDISATGCIANWLLDVSPTGDFYCPAELTIPVGAFGIPNGWTRHNIDGDKYLNFTMPNGGTITLTKNGTPTEVTLEYLIEGEPNWVTWAETNNVRSLTLSAGGKVYIRNTSETSTGFSTSENNCYNFAFTADTYAGGNTDSLLCKNPEDAVITQYCYHGLFENAATLITSPNLPSTTIAEFCYRNMFQYCTGLIKAPDILPATMLYGRCYANMFISCYSLEIPPRIAATSFSTTGTANYYCASMFTNCSSLKEAPILHSEILKSAAYYWMFGSCLALNKVTTYMTNISASSCLYNWLYKVSPTGDFYCHSELTIPTGNSGIPTGWTRHDI